MLKRSDKRRQKLKRSDKRKRKLENEKLYLTKKRKIKKIKKLLKRKD